MTTLACLAVLPMLTQPAASGASADDPAQVAALVAADSQLACALYRTLVEDAGDDENLFFSPHSISTALAMTHAGARGETRREMGRALCFDGLGEDLPAAVAALQRELERRAAAGVDSGDPFRLRVANALWGQVGYPFREPFLALLAAHHGAGVHALDFAADAEGARRAINAQVEEETEHRIRDLLAPDDVTPMTRLVLTNAIYFKASWSEPFSASNTREEPFHLRDGTIAATPLMHRTASFAFVEVKGVQVVELPYVGDEVALLVCLPPAGGLEAFERGLTGERLTALTRRLASTRVDLHLPRFGVRSQLSLRPALERLGLRAAFDPDRADFTGMSETGELYLGAAVHQATVTVDETGTEAAAATAVVMEARSIASRAVSMRVDRPFVFLVRDRPTGAVLFLGRVVDPRG